MSDIPRLQLVTPGGLVPLTTEQFRGLCANPKTQKFIIAGVSRRWLYDIIDTAPGLWGTAMHDASKGMKQYGANSGAIYTVFRKSPASDRGILIEGVRGAMKALQSSIEALILELRTGAAADDPDAETPMLALEDFTTDLSETAGAVMTFAALLGQAKGGEDGEEV